ncbi:MAG: lipopolysaccharide biosynthesis protein [Bacteroidales bacterium]|nr:lipopolysaccharide biosynthesis protein [Candidatus Colimorpha onthohippi]
MHTSLHYLFHSGKNSKALYYMHAALSQLIPDSRYQQRLEDELDQCSQLYDPDYIADRVNYYCHPCSTSLGATASKIGLFQRRGHNSTYYFDSKEIVRWFNPDLYWDYLFGDNRAIPTTPKIVKSRNLCENNGNAVLLKLNKCRHFVYLNDSIRFEDKADIAVYRGQIGTRENRIRFVNQFAGHPRIDAANTLAKGNLIATNPDGKATSPRLSLYDHLKYRFIMALEGNDVASNLKWIMSSNSLAVMPRPTCETWFMEGRLQPNVHYVEIRDDYADLIEKMDYYSNHPDEARAITKAANAYTSQFKDERRERYIGLLVMQKFLQTLQP